VYLNGTGTDQLAFQAAHEIFHVLWTPVAVHHWTHEVGAMIFSLAHLDAAGRTDQKFTAYRARWIEQATEGAKACRLADLMRSEQPYPGGFYERATLFGLQLIDIVGPAGYHGLVRPGPTGRPDFWHWVGTLPARQRRRIEAAVPPRTELD
jgi:hypothetical protein